MEEFWILILVAFFVTMSLDKAESVQFEELEELPLQTFDELFVEEWWDKDEADDLKTPAPTNFRQNIHHQIDRQNDQLGQIEPNLTDQNPPLTASDHSGQIEPNSTDQNPPLTESDHSGQFEPNSTNQNPSLTASDQSDKIGQIEPNLTNQIHPLPESDQSDNAINGEELNEITSNENIAEDERRRKIIDKFHAIKDELKQKEKFDQRKAELKRAGLKNSYPNQINETVAKELGLSFTTIYKWKRELGQTAPNHKYAHSEQKEIMKRYYEIKDKKTPKIKEEDIAKKLKIGTRTLCNWKKQFKRQQFHQNSVDGHSVEENAAENVQKIENSNSERF
uniref:Transposase n=1 Tax=Globodera rostochiensis TaxID=31243 RepID=A0A914H9D0_GLORO